MVDNILPASIVKPTDKLSYRIGHNIFYGIFKIITRLEIRNRDNLPANGALIAVCNHLNMVDPLLHLIAVYPRDCIFMAKEELFRWWPVPLFGLLMRIAEAFPVKRLGNPSELQKTIDKAITVLNNGCVFGIYPEGARSKTGKLKHAYRGAATIAYKTQSPLIPVAIWGSEKLKGWGWLSRPRVVISFGKPFTLPPVSGQPGTEQYKYLTDCIMGELAAILPPEYRGYYSHIESKATGIK